jgi:RNA polymerase sigma-70 factor (ECF subfamily)
VLDLIKRITGNSPESEDLVAEVYIKFFSHEKGFPNYKKMEYFLYTTAKNKAIDYVKIRRRMESNRHHSAGPLLNAGGEAEYPNLEAETRAHLQSVLYPYVESLNQLSRQLFEYHYIRGLDLDEIAEQLNVSKKTLENNKSLLIKMLKERVNQNGGRRLIFINIIP